MSAANALSIKVAPTRFVPFGLSADVMPCKNNKLFGNTDGFYTYFMPKTKNKGVFGDEVSAEKASGTTVCCHIRKFKPIVQAVHGLTETWSMRM